MRAYLIDEIPIPEMEKIKGFLQEHAIRSNLDEIFWVRIPDDLLNETQFLHTQCQPHVFAVELGLDWIKLELFVRTLKTMRAAMFVGDRGDLEAFTREAFRLYWEEGGAPKGTDEADEDGPVSEVARRIGADPDEVLAGAASAEAKEALKSSTAGAVERGVFGAPAFFVGEEMFWGNDRLHFVEAALKRG